MFLKSLSLRGFKTFADATEIEFDPASRITAIVGPNGCGKSNLLDAARWVLGEENPRLLRVSSLENIIFAGTDSRKPLSLAEVAVTFDNAAGKLALPYSEIAVRRRVFREGESEFAVNKNTCRLKDIHELLMDTGLGDGTYAIITQGQVDSILSSKGEERRAVFEEAAGINKYKSRKLSAERKLIAAEQNILRINDLKVEVGEQQITLEEQSRKAKQYKEIQTKVKELEIGLSKKVFSSLLEKRARLEEDLLAAQKTTEQKAAEEQKYEAELLEIKGRLRENELKIDDLLGKLDQEKDVLRDIEVNRRFVENEIAREGERLSLLEDKAKELDKKINDLENEAGFSSDGKSHELFVDICRAIANQSRHLAGLLAFICAQLGNGEVFAIVEPKEKDSARALKINFLKEEKERIEQEAQVSRFGLKSRQVELQNIASRAKDASAKDELSKNIAQLKAEREKQKIKIDELEEKIRLEEKNERAAGSATTNIEIALAKIDGEMGAMGEKLFNEYNLSVQEIENLPHQITSISKAKSEIDEGKEHMRRLEPVNLLAIEEYEKAKDRLSFIDAQLADLNGARENLDNLIKELDFKAEEVFLRTMQRLSVVFSETFSKLFSGGEAKISLAENAPILEAEIDISVRPSGRRWLPLSLLSGGERSLCAIAILFSLMKIRPSPFCFLDEVDAALDEANIGRFTEMIKDFSLQTQIVIITHNKRTMAAADNIYGITMQEAGVSKVISMKLTAGAA